MPATLDQIIHDQDRVAVFIDGANVYAATKALGFDIDYRKLLKEFRLHGRFVRATYYTAIPEDQDFSPIRPLVDWLDYNGFAVSTRLAREYTDGAGRRRMKGDMDVNIAVDMIEAASHCDHLFLFSGDGDFAPLIPALQRRGAKVTVASTIKSNPPIAADELRRAADVFLDLVDLAPVIGRGEKCVKVDFDDAYEGQEE